MKNVATQLLASFVSAVKLPYFPKVTSDRWGNRGKYIPAGEHKNLKPHNR